MRHLLSRAVSWLVGRVCRALLRAFVTGLVFVTCMLLALSYMGVRLPDAFELLDTVESVRQLSKILS